MEPIIWQILDIRINYNCLLIVAKVIAHVPSPAVEGRDEGEYKM